MPTAARVQNLVRYVLENRLIEALQEFYHDDVVMQENCDLPRVGLAANIERQKMARAMTAHIHEIRARSVLVDGDRAVIEWHAEWSIASGPRVRIEELALQTWRGDRIAHERFFYDPTPLIQARSLDPRVVN